MDELTNNLTPDDFKSDQEVRWCAGCGDRTVLNTIQKILPELNVPKEKFVFVSGIGCSSRFPYYVDTYGMHTIHGRAAAIASGVKVANRDLSVWIITGDGDSMAIGGNHYIHLIRRNIDVNLILLNNQIYGLTKGQYSPTSQFGQVTKTSPFGTIENPFSPGRLALGARARFFARAADNNIPQMKEILIAAAQHRGTSVIEILQNCVIYNNKAHDALTNREFRDDKQIYLKHGEPMIFGKEKDKGLILVNGQLRVARIGEYGITKDDIQVHNSCKNNLALQMNLVNLQHEGDMPIAMGIIRSIDDFIYNDLINQQIDRIKSKSKIKCMDDLMNSGNTWQT